jgi:hypothetical protein
MMKTGEEEEEEEEEERQLPWTMVEVKSISKQY